MTTPKRLPEQIIHSNNGHATLSPEASTTDQEKSSPTEPQSQNGDRILPATSPPMDFKKATIREVLEYFLRSNDEDAWEEFWRRVSPVIRGRCASMLGRNRSDERLDDLQQDIFLKKLWPNDYRLLRDFTWPRHDSIFSYMRVVTTSFVIDHWRKNHREILLGPEDLEIAIDRSFASQPNAEIESLRSEIDKCLRACANEKEQRIFKLYYFWGYSAKQIANIPTINLPVKKVENILQSLVRRVRSRLGRHGKNASPG